jgi:hypothetical protein
MKMTYRYTIFWAYVDLVVALAMTLALYVGLQMEWWGWLLFSPLFLYLVFECVRKASYSLTVDGNDIKVGSFRYTRYFVSKISAVHVWDANAARMAVVDFDDGSRFHFSSRLGGFDDLVGLLRTKANLPQMTTQG